MRVELKQHDPPAQRVNTTPLHVQATDSAILAGFNGAYTLTMGGGMCYPPHGRQAGTGIARLTVYLVWTLLGMVWYGMVW